MPRHRPSRSEAHLLVNRVFDIKIVVIIKSETKVLNISRLDFIQCKCYRCIKHGDLVQLISHVSLHVATVGSCVHLP